jgi:hypothetical protein
VGGAGAGGCVGGAGAGGCVGGVGAGGCVGVFLLGALVPSSGRGGGRMIVFETDYFATAPTIGSRKYERNFFSRPGASTGHGFQVDYCSTELEMNFFGFFWVSLRGFDMGYKTDLFAIKRFGSFSFGRAWGRCRCGRVCGRCGCGRVCGRCGCRRVCGRCGCGRVCGRCGCGRVCGRCGCGRVCGRCGCRRVCGRCGCRRVCGRCGCGRVCGSVSAGSLGAIIGTGGGRMIVFETDYFATAATIGSRKYERNFFSGPGASTGHGFQVDYCSTELEMNFFGFFWVSLRGFDTGRVMDNEMGIHLREHSRGILLIGGPAFEPK